MRHPGDLVTGSPSLVAIGIVLLNDHVLKHRYGSWITGKLSDVAGVFVLPLLLLSVLELSRRTSRRWPWVVSEREISVAVALTAAGFSAVKICRPVGDAYAAAIGAIRWLPRFLSGDNLGFVPIEVTRDWTDTAVLPVLIASWAIAQARSRVQNAADALRLRC